MRLVPTKIDEKRSCLQTFSLGQLGVQLLLTNKSPFGLRPIIVHPYFHINEAVRLVHEDEP